MVNKEPEIINTELMNKDEVDEYQYEWTETITVNMDITLPKKFYKLLPNVKESNTLKQLDIRNFNSKLIAEIENKLME